MALTRAERDALPADDFAVPETRDLPMHDEKHARMAWDMVDRTKGLSDAQRQSARQRILRRAKELGMDTVSWSKLKAMSFEAMALAMPDGEHPNRMPFSGYLVPVDHVSEKPVGGSGGRLVVISANAATKALSTLLGMGVNYTEKLDGHDAQRKIGIIDVADVRPHKNEDWIYIEGFIYASDFPDAAARIRADKDVLGFSFEARNITLADPGADPLVVEDCVFTGAAILLKEKAAFMTTALAANAEGQPQEIEMTPEELQAVILAAMKPTNDRLDAIEAAAKDPIKLQAANLQHMVEPHAKALEAAADAMCAAGIGGDDTRGHAVIVKKMAAHMRAEAAKGHLPNTFNEAGYYASGTAPATLDAAAIKTAVEEAVKPLNDKLAATETKLADLSTKAFNASAEPTRSTVSADIVQLLAKGGVKDDAKLTVAQADELLEKAGIKGTKAIEAKLNLQAAGRIAA